MRPFSYNTSAELFPAAIRKKKRAGFAYRRFGTAAEAVRFAIEELPAKQREVVAEIDAGAVTLADGQLAIEHYWAGALRRAVVDGDVETGSLMAGQSVGMVTAVEPVAAIIAGLVGEAEAALVARAA